MVAYCHTSFSPFPCCKTHSSFCCINIHQLDCSLACEPLSLLVPRLIFISHAPCLPSLSLFFPRSLLYSLNEVSALELSLWHRLWSLRKNLTESQRLTSGMKDGRVVRQGVTLSGFSLSTPSKAAPETHIREQAVGLGRLRPK